MAVGKDINTFGTSFLDLLTCALAAVIILFVIVPKAQYEAESSAGTQAERKNPYEAVPDTAGFDSKALLGIFSGFGVLAEWPQRDVVVNIEVQRYGSHPERCSSGHPLREWGVLLRETRPEAGKNRCSLFFMPDIYPDSYTIWVELDTRSRAKRADVTATMVFHPGCPDEDRYVTGPIPLSGSNRVYIATISIADCGLIKLSHRDPLE